jgi:hypothetical protein
MMEALDRTHMGSETTFGVALAGDGAAATGVVAAQVMNEGLPRH